ncbi:MAG TPA: ATP-binding cassette domain-containing protein [bacterium]|nr:ATP-binding cassette domain-containing protein [bacterium]HQG46570.1 ATP-binding cassette domain-containing protein [bacterium]HQI47579.1 ATP-binding cassette domain-containing protein [bacterium]HQJ64357.1 ATP-binding cassette domain-containing protein [bacterium]HQJ65469.1 ATP-binding cassette domain-containing protein [bacterium]
MITVRGVHKSFEEKEVLTGIDLDIPDNNNLVILGPSGQGKTVFIKTLVRLIEPDAGSIAYDGDDILKMSRKEWQAYQNHIAFVFQNSALFDFLDVRENLSLFLRMHKRLSPFQMYNEVSRAINFVGLGEDVLDKFPEELSGGMRKRVAIARAMIKRPKYIFYDEPTTGLDQNNAEKVSELILMLKNEIAATSIIVTHDIKLMRDVADRVALLREGNISFTGTKEEISAETLEFLYETRGEYDL